MKNENTVEIFYETSDLICLINSVEVKTDSFNKILSKPTNYRNLSFNFF